MQGFRMLSRPSALACLLGPAMLVAFASEASAASPQYDYVDAASYLSSDAEIEAWYRLRQRLRVQFDDICGDTFCEGDYSNIESLRFTCSVDRASGRIGQCVWVFAGSQEYIDPIGGRVQVEARSWRCKAPLAQGTRMEALLFALAGESPLYAALPGTQGSVYDGLVECL